MNPNRIPPILWVFPLALMTLACPTRTVPPDGGDHGDAGDDADSGRSRDSGADRPSAGGAGGIRGTGGAGGIGGVGGTGGSAGTGGGSGLGGVGAGGVAGIAGTVRDGQPCALSKDCTSGACTPFYVDVDNDGYGAGQAIGFCGTTPPVGYSAQSGDCCDSASNLAIAKLIHPGADFQTTSAGGVCNITWDYDCSGIVEKNRMDCTSCTQDPCSCIYASFPDSDCGSNQAGVSCSLAGAPTPTCQSFAGGAGPVACK
jgi:hypothetical protein